MCGITAMYSPRGPISAAALEQATLRLTHRGPDGEQTWVVFKHAGWKEPIEFMHHCSTKWAVFLLSMRDWLEREEGRPSPYDIKIHVGD